MAPQMVGQIFWMLMPQEPKPTVRISAMVAVASIFAPNAT